MSSVMPFAFNADKFIPRFFSLIPLKGNTKAPDMKGWATASNEEVARFFKDNYRQGGNVGIRTGKWSGVIIFDCDKPRRNNPKATDGNEDFENLCLEHNEEIPDTVTDLSGSEATRYWFKYDPNVKYKSKVAGCNIDVLADGKQALYAGSICPGCCKFGENNHKCPTRDNNVCLYGGNKYKWLKSPEEHEILSVPNWLLPYITEQPKCAATDAEVEDVACASNIIPLLDALPLNYWVEYETWKCLVIIMVNYDVPEEVIHRYSSVATNYEEGALNTLIRNAPTYNTVTIGTFMKYLKDSLSKDEFNRAMLEFKRACRKNDFVVEELKADVEMAEKALSEDIMYEQAPLTFIRSNMRMFKITCLVDFLSKNLNMKVLVVSPRVSLAQKYKDELSQYGFKMYQDLEKGSIMEDRVVVQIDSLHRVMNDYELVVFDECETTLVHLCSFIKRKVEVCETLGEILKCAKKVVVMDALLSNPTVDFFKTLCPHESLVIDNQFQAFEGTKCTMYVSTSQSFVNLAVHRAELSKKLFIPSG